MRSGSLFTAALLLALGPLAAVAAEPMAFQARGRITQLLPGTLSLTTNTNVTWSIDLHPEKQQIRVNGGGPANIVVRGTWSRDQLRPSMIVRFHAPEPKRNVIEEPIEELTWFTPTAESQPGVFDGENGMKFIVGQVAGLQKDTITINIPSGTIRGTLAPHAKLLLDLNEMTPVKVGDEASVSGYYFTEPLGIAMDVEITVPTIVAADRPNSTTPRRPTRPTRNEPAAEPQGPLAEDPFALPDPEDVAREAATKEPVAAAPGRPAGGGKRGEVLEIN